jgi:hypothetical protein
VLLTNLPAKQQPAPTRPHTRVRGAVSPRHREEAGGRFQAPCFSFVFYSPLGCCSGFEAQGGPSSPCAMELASTGDLRRSLTLRRNSPSEAPLATRSPCLCQIPSHITDDVTATFRAGAPVPPVLRWQYKRLVYSAFTALKYLSRYGCSPNDFLGPTGLGNERHGLHNPRRTA